MSIIDEVSQRLIAAKMSGTANEVVAPMKLISTLLQKHHTRVMETNEVLPTEAVAKMLLDVLTELARLAPDSPLIEVGCAASAHCICAMQILQSLAENANEQRAIVDLVEDRVGLSGS